MPPSGLGMASTRSVIAIAKTASAKKISRSSASVLSTPDPTSEPWRSVSPAAPWPASTVSEAYPAPLVAPIVTLRGLVGYALLAGTCNSCDPSAPDADHRIMAQGSMSSLLISPSRRVKW